MFIFILGALCTMLAFAGALVFVLGVILLIADEEPLFVVMIGMIGGGVCLIFGRLAEILMF